MNQNTFRWINVEQLKQLCKKYSQMNEKELKDKILQGNLKDVDHKQLKTKILNLIEFSKVENNSNIIQQQIDQTKIEEIKKAQLQAQTYFFFNSDIKITTNSLYPFNQPQLQQPLIKQNKNCDLPKKLCKHQIQMINILKQDIEFIYETNVKTQEEFNNNPNPNIIKQQDHQKQKQAQSQNDDSEQNDETFQKNQWRMIISDQTPEQLTPQNENKNDDQNNQYVQRSIQNHVSVDNLLLNHEQNTAFLNNSISTNISSQMDNQQRLNNQDQQKQNMQQINPLSNILSNFNKKIESIIYSNVDNAGIKQVQINQIQQVQPNMNIRNREQIYVLAQCQKNNYQHYLRTHKSNQQNPIWKQQCLQMNNKNYQLRNNKSNQDLQLYQINNNNFNFNQNIQNFQFQQEILDQVNNINNVQFNIVESRNQSFMDLRLIYFPKQQKQLLDLRGQRFSTFQNFNFFNKNQILWMNTKNNIYFYSKSFQPINELTFKKRMIKDDKLIPIELNLNSIQREQIQSDLDIIKMWKDIPPNMIDTIKMISQDKQIQQSIQSASSEELVLVSKWIKGSLRFLIFVAKMYLIIKGNLIYVLSVLLALIFYKYM